MKKYLAVLVIFSLFFLGCTPTPQKLNQETAVRLMNEAGCMWNIQEPSVSVSLIEQYYVISSQGCLGECRIHTITRKIQLDDNPMCTNGGLLTDGPPIDIKDDEVGVLIG